tara:strand:+ start:5432 stop:6391 length:960 start_codon:yes stop_codon:yes gene_type:complete
MSNEYLTQLLKHTRLTGTRPYPAVGSPTTDVQSLRQVIEALKLRSEIQARERGNILDSYVTLKDLSALGLIDAEGLAPAAGSVATADYATTAGSATTATNAAGITGITTEGDLIVVDASGDLVSLAIGASGEVPVSDGTTVAWGSAPGGWTVVSGPTTISALTSEVETAVESGFDYMVELYDTDVSLDDYLAIQLSEGGADADGPSDYAWGYIHSTNGGNVAGSASPLDDVVRIGALTDAANVGIEPWHVITITDPSSATLRTRFNWVYHNNSTAANQSGSGMGQRNAAATATHFRVFWETAKTWDAGTIRIFKRPSRA